jgi:hypothetical protein
LHPTGIYLYANISLIDSYRKLNGLNRRIWLQGTDSNRRPLRYEPSELTRLLYPALTNFKEQFLNTLLSLIALGFMFRGSGQLFYQMCYLVSVPRNSNFSYNLNSFSALLTISSAVSKGFCLPVFVCIDMFLWYSSSYFLKRAINRRVAPGLCVL